MNQILNIFKKDTRQLWLEILLTVVVTFAFAGAFPNEWKVFHDPSLRQRMIIIVGCLGLLMITGWWLLIARVVHAETLVGDRQFWITRPYEWKKLLAAKVLFVAAWIGVPYLLAQSLILVEGGFSPVAYVPGLLFNLLGLGTIFLLPVISLAVVTSNFARLTLTLLAGVVLFTGYSYLIAVPRGYTSSNPYTNVLLYPLLFVGCAVAIALQYATRRTWISRGLLIALPILLAITVSIYHRQSLVDRAYPQRRSTDAALLMISSNPNPAYPIQARSWDNQDYIDMPVQYSSVADGYAVFSEDLKFTITAADGGRWTSPWQTSRERILADSHRAGLHLMISPAVYDHFKAGPVTLQVTFALSLYKADTVTKTTFPARDAAVPGFGFCSQEREFGNSMLCRTAVRPPRTTHAVAVWTDVRCSNPDTSSAKTGSVDSWFESNNHDFALASVWTPRFFFFNRYDEEISRHSHWNICPGSPLTLTEYHLVDRTQSDLTLTNFVLPAVVNAT